MPLLCGFSQLKTFSANPFTNDVFSSAPSPTNRGQQIPQHLFPSHNSIEPPSAIAPDLHWPPHSENSPDEHKDSSGNIFQDAQPAPPCYYKHENTFKGDIT